MIRKSLAFSLWFVFVCWTTSAVAIPIEYSYTYYTAYAAAYNNGSVDEENLAENYPVKATGSLPPVETIAGWEDPPISVSASSSGYNDVNTDVKGGDGRANADLTFDLNYPKVRIKFNYGIVTYADSDDTWSAAAYSRGNLKVTISSPHILGYAWQFQLNSGPNESQTGSVDEIVDLGGPTGSGYMLSFSIDELSTAQLYPNATYASASAHVWINNIEVEALPLPSTLLLLGSGLLGLLGVRKKFRG